LRTKKAAKQQYETSNDFRNDKNVAREHHVFAVACTYRQIT
jgi:hypothetical protein